MAAGDLRIPAAIGVGGGIGSIARDGLGEAFPAAGDQLPWSTLAANVSGALLLGLLIGSLAAAAAAGRVVSPLVRPFLGTGVLGGYTTFSTFAVQTRHLPLPSAAAYIGLSVAGGLAAAAAGARLGAAALGGPPPVLPVDPDLP
jgi:CrcB protein